MSYKIYINFINNWFNIIYGRIKLLLFPFFENGTMYKGMKKEKKYTLKELGLFEEDK